MNTRHAYIVILFFISIVACNMPKGGNGENTLLAEAFGHRLYSSEIEPYLEKLHSRSDSQYAVSQYIDKWILDVILIEEAKKQIRDRSKINQLVKSYEESLMIQELESSYINSDLDTFVSRSEIDTFFKYHKEDFKLQEGIMRFLFLKIDAGFVNDTLASLWETEDLPALNQYINKNNGFALLDVEEWYQFSFLKNILPQGMYAKISLNKSDSYTYTENDQHFYLKVFEIIDEKDEAPVSYVKERIKLRIVQDRIKSLMKSKKAELFNAKIKSKQIKIYGKEN